MGLGPKSFACRTPSHFSTGWGAFHLRFPTGGAANGTPLNTLTPEQSMPSSVPLAVCTCGAVCAAAPIYAAPSMIIDRIVFFILIIVLFSYKNYFTLHSQQAIVRRNGRLADTLHRCRQAIPYRLMILRQFSLYLQHQADILSGRLCLEFP